MSDDYIPWWVPADSPRRTGAVAEPEAVEEAAPLPEMFPVLTEAVADPATEVVADPPADPVEASS